MCLHIRLRSAHAAMITYDSTISLLNSFVKDAVVLVRPSSNPNRCMLGRVVEVKNDKVFVELIFKVCMLFSPSSLQIVKDSEKKFIKPEPDWDCAEGAVHIEDHVVSELIYNNDAFVV